MALYGRSKLAGFRQFLGWPNGIPSPDRFRRVFMVITPDAFAVCFPAWGGVLAISAPLGSPEVVVLAGKTRRRSFDRGHDLAAWHVVSAWASDQRLG